jgi:hypothetical protein
LLSQLTLLATQLLFALLQRGYASLLKIKHHTSTSPSDYPNRAATNSVRKNFKILYWLLQY